MDSTALVLLHNKYIMNGKHRIKKEAIQFKRVDFVKIKNMFYYLIIV